MSHFCCHFYKLLKIHKLHSPNLVNFYLCLGVQKANSFSGEIMRNRTDLSLLGPNYSCLVPQMVFAVFCIYKSIPK